MEAIMFQLGWIIAFASTEFFWTIHQRIHIFNEIMFFFFFFFFFWKTMLRVKICTNGAKYSFDLQRRWFIKKSDIVGSKPHFQLKNGFLPNIAWIKGRYMYNSDLRFTKTSDLCSGNSEQKISACFSTALCLSNFKRNVAGILCFWAKTRDLSCKPW